MKILQINSSARTEGAASTRIADSLVARLMDRQPGATLEVRDLAKEPAAQLDDVAVTARMTPPEARTPWQAARAAQDDALIQQLLCADIVVIGAPMYNFNISAHLKNWIDGIVKPGVTFRYTETGPVGLIGGKTVYIALTRGGFYRDTPADTPAHHLKHVFAFLGITDVHFVYAEGMARGPDVAAKAFRDADDQIIQLVA
ncbi:FMN-dependent NADH-azoreductase [Azospirillum doebereinerae]